MRDQDQIDAFQRGDFFLASIVNRIGQPGIDQEHIARRRNDFKSRLTVPSQLGLRGHTCHQSENVVAGKIDIDKIDM